LKAIERKYHSLTRRAVETQLRFEPDVETRNRKPLRYPNVLGAEWELRFGPGNRFRVFYEVDWEGHKVYILTLGEEREAVVCR